VPDKVAVRFAGLDGDRDGTHAVAAELAAEQIAELAEHGVEHVHLYTLNRAELALAVGERLGAVDRVGS
jgi:methylenetetrahydrofolate reductase (NADPH)